VNEAVNRYVIGTVQQLKVKCGPMVTNQKQGIETNQLTIITNVEVPDMGKLTQILGIAGLPLHQVSKRILCFTASFTILT